MERTDGACGLRRGSIEMDGSNKDEKVYPYDGNFFSSARNEKIRTLSFTQLFISFYP